MSIDCLCVLFVLAGGVSSEECDLTVPLSARGAQPTTEAVAGHMSRTPLEEL